jgi:hypothetical protein
VGATYRAAGAEQLVFSINYRDLRLRLAEAVGLRPAAAPPELAAALAQRRGLDEARCQALLEEGDRLLNAKALSRPHLFSLYHKLAQLEVETPYAH